MQPISRLGTPRNDPRTTMKLQMLIADLSRQVQLLNYDLHEEEKRTGSFDASDILTDLLHLESTVAELGWPVTPGAGVSAAAKELADGR